MDHKFLKLAFLALALSLTTLADGAPTISPLPPQYWVHASFNSQNSSSLIGLSIYPLLGCASASSFNSYIGGSSNESRYGVFLEGKLNIFFCNSTNCTNCSSFTTVPLNQYSSNEDSSYTMFLANQLPPIQPRSLVVTVQETYTCPAASSYIQYIAVQSPSCHNFALDGSYDGMLCNGTGTLTVSQCSDNQCLQDCKVSSYGPFGPCGSVYCIDDLLQGMPIPSTTPNSIPKSIPAATSNSSESGQLSALLLLIAIVIVL